MAGPTFPRAQELPSYELLTKFRVPSLNSILWRTQIRLKCGWLLYNKYATIVQGTTYCLACQDSIWDTALGKMIDVLSPLETYKVPFGMTKPSH